MSWKKKQLRIKALFIAILLSVFSCESGRKEKTSRVDQLPYYNEASFTPNWLNRSSKELKDFHKIPVFSLTNQEGRLITEQTFNDKIYVTDFFFTSCPGICPKMTDNMLLVQEAFADDDDILLLSHSVTPTKDSVDVLRNYAEAKGVINGKWHLVTGDRSTIYHLGRSAYFAEEDLGRDKTEEDFLHTENFILIDKNRHIRGIYNGLNKTDVLQLIADIKTLKKEYTL
ncbi:MAG: SCO family protein [bacterium]